MSFLLENIRDEEVKGEAKEILVNKSGEQSTVRWQGLRIIRAIYKSGKNQNEANVTRTVRKMVSANKLTVTSSNEIVDGNDPHYGEPKELIIDYAMDADIKQVSVTEGQSITLP